MFSPIYKLLYPDSIKATVKEEVRLNFRLFCYIVPTLFSDDFTSRNLTQTITSYRATLSLYTVYKHVNTCTYRTLEGVNKW